jgi:hypothetical protein
MFQRVIVQSYDNDKEEKTLEFLMESYPLNISIFDELM